MATEAEAAEILRKMSDEIEARTGYKTFHYVSAPTPYSLRIVILSGEVASSWAQAGERIAEVRRAVEAGTWQHWVCRLSCAWMFDSEAERDAHEVSAHGG